MTAEPARMLLLSGLAIALALFAATPGAATPGAATPGDDEAASASGPATPTTVILVRHAEKTTGEDPALSAAGVERAATLAAMLAEQEVAAIYSTPFERTRRTAAPLAGRRGIEVTIIEPTATHAVELASRIRSAHRGETVIVVGHSNTVPEIIAALGAPPPELTEADYDGLFVVTLGTAGDVGLLTLRYGEIQE